MANRVQTKGVPFMEEENMSLVCLDANKIEECMQPSQDQIWVSNQVR